jgi:hypothetical protein
MSLIPIDMENVPTRRSSCDESLVYEVIVRDVEVSQKKDKNGNTYLRVDTEVLGPDEWKSRRLPDNYLCLPAGYGELKDRLGREPKEYEIRNGMEQGARFARFVRAFKVPYTTNGIDPRDAIGREGRVTIVNEEYPAGSGEVSSKIKEYIA